MFHYSLNRAPDSSKQPTHERWPSAFKWISLADQRDLKESIQSLTDAFNDLEQSISLIRGSWNGPVLPEPSFEIAQRMSSDFQTIYNECEYLIDNHSARFNADLLYLLKELRNLFAHRFGTSMDRSMLVPITVECILPMKESLRSSLYEVIKNNPEIRLKERVLSFNLRPRRRFR